MIISAKFFLLSNAQEYSMHIFTHYKQSDHSVCQTDGLIVPLIWADKDGISAGLCRYCIKLYLLCMYIQWLVLTCTYSSVCTYNGVIIWFLRSTMKFSIEVPAILICVIVGRRAHCTLHIVHIAQCAHQYAKIIQTI